MIYRTGNKKKFSFHNDQGEIAILPPHLSGISIPPAWTEVVLNPDPVAKIYVTGKDKKGRKQYLYNPEFLEKRNKHKFSRLRFFVNSLPYLRSRVNELLKLNRWTKEKVLAIAIRLLDEVSIRVGNECYKKENGSYGLTTLEKRHFTRKNGQYLLRFRGKSGKDHDLVLTDPRLCRYLARLKQLPGNQLLQYRDQSGKIRSLRPADINSFLKSSTGGNITAKDFRTWKGTVLAVKKALDVKSDPVPKSKKKLINQVVSHVSKALGNTLAICKSYYIHPVVIRMLEDESLPEKAYRLQSSLKGTRARFSQHERVVARLLYRLT